MKNSTRKTRSATRAEMSQHVEIRVKKEEDTNFTNSSLNPFESIATSSADPIVKVEENDTLLKSHSLRIENRKVSNNKSSIFIICKSKQMKTGALPDRNGSKNYCKVCEKGFCSKGTYEIHRKTAIHKKRSTWKQLSPEERPDEFDPNFSVKFAAKHTKRYQSTDGICN